MSNNTTWTKEQLDRHNEKFKAGAQKKRPGGDLKADGKIPRSYSPKPPARVKQHRSHTPGVTTIDIKPLSVNDVWQGRRFKTPEYKSYESALLLILPNLTLPEPPYEIHYRFGFSSKASDFDNPVKPLTDILSKRYKFNDKLIFKAVIEKEIVQKGDEFFSFKIESYDVLKNRTI